MKRLRYIFFTLVPSAFLAAPVAFAQVDTGTSFISDTIGLSSGDPRIIAAKIIQIFLGFLGIILVGLIIYGGYTWMTSQGDEEKIEQAKKILTNAVIGFVIIIASVAITQFIIRSLVGERGVFGGGPGGVGDGGGGGRLGVNTLLVRSISPPEGATTVRNTVIRIELNQPIDPATFTPDDVRVFDATDGQSAAIPVTVAISERVRSRIEVRSNARCEAPNNERFCFAGNRQIRVEVIDKSFASAGGLILSCANGNCIRHFATNNLVDTSDPTVSITSPQNGAFVPQGFVPIAVRAVDDTGVASVDVTVDRRVVGTAVVPPFDVLWDAGDAPLNSEHEIRAEVVDLADNSAVSAVVRVRVRAAHCYDGIQSGNEQGIDCGGNDCGSCAGGQCQQQDQCASGACRDGVCVAWPLITDVSPSDGGVGTFVTITGQFFGDRPGRVVFLGDVANAADDALGTPPRCALLAWWSDRQLVVSVPRGAVDGPIRVEARSGFFDTTENDRGPKGTFDVTNTVRPGLCAVVSQATEKPEGVAGELIAAIGAFFGQVQGRSVLNIGGRAASVLNWEASRIDGKVPSVRTGPVQAQVVVDGTPSNPVAFRVLADPAGSLPEIISLDPNPVSVGGYLTIRGRNFGNQPSRVFFVKLDGTEVLMEPVAEACGAAWWQSNQVIVRVPRGLPVGEEVGVIVERADQKRSVAASVGTAAGGRPSVCAIVPDNGPAGIITASLIGQGFGRQAGKVVMRPNVEVRGGDGWAWADERATFRVPLGAQTGEVQLVDAAGSVSNAVLFTVSACNPQDARSCGAGSTCCADQSCRPVGECRAVPPLRFYEWSFTTRQGGGEGGRCEVDNDCREGLQCENGQCVPDPDGDPTFCRANADCAAVCGGSQCVANHCTPQVSEVTPANGRQGTWVTIRGCFFGALKGSVAFLGGEGAEDDKPALYPNEGLCGNAWSNDTITVEVPNAATEDPADDARTGPLLVTTAHRSSVSTPIFTVDGTIQPGICRLNPGMGKEGDRIEVIGQNFGDRTPEASAVRFQSFDRNQGSDGRIRAWSNQRITVTVPQGLDAIKENRLDGAAVGVQVKLLQGQAGGRESNEVPFYLPPFITKLAPDRGPAGVWVTITGGNFGLRRGALGSVSFNGTIEGLLPEWCAPADTWTPTQIVTAAPAGVTTGPVFVRTDRGFVTARRDTKPFTKTDDPLGPSLCALNPSRGPVGVAVSVAGDRFGNRGPDDTLIFSAKDGAITRWENTEIGTEAPLDAETGLVTVRKTVERSLGRQCVGGVEIGEQCVGGNFQEQREQVVMESNPLLFTIETGRPGDRCNDDGDCQFGCDEAGGVCIQPPPEEFLRVLGVQPVGNDACPNGAPEVAFSPNLDPDTITDDTVYLLRESVDVGGRPAPCPAGVLSEVDANGRTWCRVAADTQPYGSFPEPFTGIFPRALLSINTNHRVIVRGPDAQGVGGVRNLAGLPIGNANRGGDYTHEFRTRGEICRGDRVGFVPNRLSFRNRANLSSEVLAQLLTAEGRLLAPVPGYRWGWSWQSPKPELFSARDLGNGLARVTSTGTNGSGSVQATATIEGANSPISGSLPVDTFICENPWPAEGDFEDATFGFRMRYCRDQKGGALPLPPLIVQRAAAGPRGIAWEYLLQPQGTNDVIGSRIIWNGKHLSPDAWYQAQDFDKGSPRSVMVDGYSALEDGRTTYINFARLIDELPGIDDDDAIETYMGVFSFNNDAQEETKEIYKRLMASLRFTVNVLPNHYGHPDAPGALRRDIRRMADMVAMRAVLDNRAAVGALPTLRAGSYLRGFSTSAWPSWQETLGAALQTTLPRDPKNQFMQPCDPAARADAAFDPQTCWSEHESRFSCRFGVRNNPSSVYAYRVLDGSHADLYTYFEFKNNRGRMTWSGEQERVLSAQGDFCNPALLPSSCFCFNAKF